MTTKEPILDGARSEFAEITRTALSSWGMLPDPDHLKGGGYHCGCQDIKNIGKWATAGSTSADYSVRQKRDRVGGNTSMAIDGPPKWGNGGDAAWIRHNNLLQQAMEAGDPELGALRAINFTPDGKVKCRYDTNNRGQGIVSSTDTVLWHTHYEFWRDTAGTDLLRRTVTRMAYIMRVAINGGPLFPPREEEMAGFARDPNTGQLYYVNGMHSRPIADSDIGHILYTADQGFSPQVTRRPAKYNPVEWESDLIRRGWGPNWAGAVVGQGIDVAALTVALRESLNVTIGEDVVLAALESARGQAAMVQAANTAEDS